MDYQKLVSWLFVAIVIGYAAFAAYYIFSLRY
jgi:hypothetical protein